MKIVHAIASIITIITALLNVSFALVGQRLNISPPQINLNISNIFVKIIIFFYLELFISLFFGYIKIKIRDFLDTDKDFWKIVLLPLILAILLISAWTSVFNVEWIFLDLSWNYKTFFSIETVKLIFWSLFSISIMGFIGGYMEDIVVHQKMDEFDSELSQIFAIIHSIFIFIVIIYKFFSG